MIIFNLFLNSLPYTFDISHHLIVPKAYHMYTVMRKKDGAFLVVLALRQFSVLTSIKFYSNSLTGRELFVTPLNPLLI